MKKSHKLLILVVLATGLLLLSQALSVSAKKTDKGVIAPSWGKTEWINLPAGKKSLDISDYRGKVVYLAFFQEW